MNQIKIKGDYTDIHCVLHNHAVVSFVSIPSHYACMNCVCIWYIFLLHYTQCLLNYRFHLNHMCNIHCWYGCINADITTLYNVIEFRSGR